MPDSRAELTAAYLEQSTLGYVGGFLGSLVLWIVFDLAGDESSSAGGWRSGMSLLS